MKNILYCDKLFLPDAVRVVSEGLQLDHTFFPQAGSLNNIGIHEYIDLLSKHIFEHVMILCNNNQAYINDCIIDGKYSMTTDGKLYLNEWVDLSDYEKVIYV